jgi:hypothetical protein
MRKITILVRIIMKMAKNLPEIHAIVEGFLKALLLGRVLPTG